MAPHDIASRKHRAEYLLRMPFSLQKIHWNESTKTVIYRSRELHVWGGGTRGPESYARRQ